MYKPTTPFEKPENALPFESKTSGGINDWNPVEAASIALAARGLQSPQITNHWGGNSSLPPRFVLYDLMHDERKRLSDQ